MITHISVRHFKRLDTEEFDLRGQHVVLAGPNNFGKTTALQAVAAWGFAVHQWRLQNDMAKHNGFYARRPVTRQQFTVVPLPTFRMLWSNQDTREDIEVRVRTTDGHTIAMQFEYDSSEQLYVRPSADTDSTSIRALKLLPVFVPPMTGVSVDEPQYQPQKIAQLIGLNRPGDVLRNLLLQAASRGNWELLAGSIRSLFNVELLRPDASGADIRCEYRHVGQESALDLSCAGSGFQQVLMLLTYLETQPGSVLLIDEPDAHLHVFLQEAIFEHLRSAAIRTRSQLIVSTHSEVIIDSVAIDEVYLVLDRVRRLASEDERELLGDALQYIDNVDVMKARQCPGVLYVEDYTDINILREWAAVLSHPAKALLGPGLFWKKLISDSRAGVEGLKARDHHKLLQIIKSDFPAVELVDGDSKPTIVSTPVSGKGFQRLRWKRYEIESYLFHPKALERFVIHQIGEASSGTHVEDLAKHLADTYPPKFLREPFSDDAWLVNTKARTQLIPQALTAAGIHGLHYTEYYRIAASMLPEDIHPAVRDMLDNICRAFGVQP